MRPIVTFLLVAVLLIFAALVSFVCGPPWIKKNQAVALGNWRLANYEFQVWQRRTPFIFEPFATGLFVRSGTNSWQVFCLDHQDRYAPRIELSKKGSEIHVLRNHRTLGVFDTSNQTFRYGPDKPVVTPGGLGGDSEPPGKWWLMP